jgi:DNA repair exonuclease SbcCD ATPase subunit
MDLYPAELRLKNLYCFKGEHSVALEPTVYAVMAQADDNPARSNWLGKSTLLLSFAYALFGWHTKRTDNEIITTGQDECMVALRLNDGTIIERTKADGKSEQLRFIAPGKKPITQALAQKAIEQHIGVSKDNFFAMHFFEQKRIGALVTARGAERSNIIEGWLAEELDPIVRLNDAAVRAHKKATLALADLERELAELKEDWRKLVVDMVGTEDATIDIKATIDDLLAKAEADYASKKLELEAARKVATEEEVQARLIAEKAKKAAEYKAIVEKGLEVRAEFDKIPADVQAKYEKAQGLSTAALSTHQEAQKELRRLESGNYVFDGQCPIACKACPSKAWVSEQATGEAALASAQTKAKEAARRRQETGMVTQAAQTEALKRAALETQLTALRAKAEQLADDAEEVEASEEAEKKPSKATERVAALETALEGLAEKVRQFKEDKAWSSKAIARVWELETHIHHAKEKRALTVEAVQLTSRTGAQQAIQEIVMAKIETKANDLLTKANIPLQIGVKWEQETNGLAKVCPTCGTAFPTSQRVKACESCGAARGPNVQSKLLIEPTNRSGAADDLAGVALGIAASRWLRAQRGSQWSAVFIDEPFGALDAHNRMALGSHIASMLRTEFSSAFVVAHERSVLMAMPAQLKIAAGPDGSRIEGTVT